MVVNRPCVSCDNSPREHGRLPSDYDQCHLGDTVTAPQTQRTADTAIQPPDETAEEALRRRLDTAEAPEDTFTAFQRYSSERCADLNSDGHQWDCPENSVDPQPSAAAREQAGSIVADLLDELAPPSCTSE